MDPLYHRCRALQAAIEARGLRDLPPNLVARYGLAVDSLNRYEQQERQRDLGGWPLALRVGAWLLVGAWGALVTVFTVQTAKAAPEIVDYGKRLAEGLSRVLVWAVGLGAFAIAGGVAVRASGRRGGTTRRRRPKAAAA